MNTHEHLITERVSSRIAVLKKKITLLEQVLTEINLGNTSTDDEETLGILLTLIE